PAAFHCSTKQVQDFPEFYPHEGIDAKEIEAYKFDKYPPFYALGKDYRVAAFDIPQSVLSDDVNGPQVLAWGAHSPQTPSHSSPPELLDDIRNKFGEHPALHRDHGEWWNADYLKRVHGAMKTGIERRIEICRDWLAQERWDLFFTIFGEPHSAGHDLWHLSRPDHPLYGEMQDVFGFDPLLDIFKAVDVAIGEILDAAPSDAYKLVFSVHGSDNNVTDVASMVLLPEFLYRYSFPGKTMMAVGDPNKPVGGVAWPLRMREWQHEIWDHRYDPNPTRRLLKKFAPARAHRRINRLISGELAPDLYSQAELKSQGKEVCWQPTSWYSKVWKDMKAFALPTFSEGYIRINLKDREPSGVVEPQDYEAVCDDIIAELRKVVNPRTGEPVVKDVVRTRDMGSNRDPNLPPADLVVVWNDVPADVIDHKELGRIGPVPYRRAGSHRGRGFWALQGQGIEEGTEFPLAHAVDLTATIMQLLGAGVPAYMDGKPIELKPSVAVAS
ncbi:MAG: nucleotide pyrophosphatase, partial [Pseudomonadota bacterium]